MPNKIDPDKLKDSLSTFNDASRYRGWKDSLDMHLKAKGLSFIMLTRDEMVKLESSYGMDEGEEKEETPKITPFTTPQPNKPDKPILTPYVPTGPIDVSQTNKQEEHEAKMGREMFEYQQRKKKWKEEMKQWAEASKEHYNKEAKRVEMLERKQKETKPPKRHRTDKQPTLVEWEELNLQVCAALYNCVPIGVRDIVRKATILHQLLTTLDSHYLFTGALAQINQREIYKSFKFSHKINPIQQFDHLEHLERLCLECGDAISENDKASYLITRLDDHWKQLIMDTEMVIPDLTKSYDKMKVKLETKWNNEVLTHLHSNKRDDRDGGELENALYAGGKQHKKKGEQRENQQRDQKKQQYSKKLRKVSCYNCGEKGHMAKECPKPRTAECQQRLDADKRKYEERAAKALDKASQASSSTPSITTTTVAQGPPKRIVSTGFATLAMGVKRGSSDSHAFGGIVTSTPAGVCNLRSIPLSCFDEYTSLPHSLPQPGHSQFFSEGLTREINTDKDRGMKGTRQASDSNSFGGAVTSAPACVCDLTNLSYYHNIPCSSTLAPYNTNSQTQPEVHERSDDDDAYATRRDEKRGDATREANAGHLGVGQNDSNAVGGAVTSAPVPVCARTSHSSVTPSNSFISAPLPTVTHSRYICEDFYTRLNGFDHERIETKEIKSKWFFDQD